MLQMITHNVEAQRWIPLRTSPDTVSPPRNVRKLFHVAQSRKTGLPKHTPNQRLSKIDGSDAFRQHEVDGALLPLQKQCVTPAVCALKIRVSLVRFRPWAPLLPAKSYCVSKSCAALCGDAQIRVSCEFAVHSDAVPDVLRRGRRGGCQHDRQHFRPHDHGAIHCSGVAQFSESCSQFSNAWACPSWAVSSGDSDAHDQAG